MNDPLCFEELEIGQSWVSPRRTVTETDIVNFACHTGDFDPLHVDHEFASQTPFRRPLAHGLLGLAWVAGLASTSPRVHTVAFVGIQDWQFLKPIFVGDTVSARVEVADKRPAGRRSGEIIWQRQLLNQHDEIAQSGQFITRVACERTVRLPRRAA